MSPSKLLNNYIALYHDLANVNRMVSTNFVILDTLIFTLITISKSKYHLGFKEIFLQVILIYFNFQRLLRALLILVFVLLLSLLLFLLFCLFIITLVTFIRKLIIIFILHMLIISKYFPLIVLCH
jgi:hypothetical protein